LIKLVEFQGDNEILIIQIDDPNKTEIKVSIIAGGKRYKREETCWLRFKPKHVHLFNDEEKAIIKR
jgi:ABC-type sugar transport system ATPase subunit